MVKNQSWYIKIGVACTHTYKDAIYYSKTAIDPMSIGAATQLFVSVHSEYDLFLLDW